MSIESSVGYLLFAGLTGRTGGRVALAGAVVAGECLVFVGNGLRCPLSDLAESYCCSWRPFCIGAISACDERRRPRRRQLRVVRLWPAARGWATLDGMTNDHMDGAPAAPLRRSRQDRVLGGVCAGIAHRLGVDSTVLRIAAVGLLLVSGGSAGMAYLLAWMLIPPAGQDELAAPTRLRSVAGAGGAREAWIAAGGELRSLAAGVRTARPKPDTEAEQRERTPTAAIDAALTKVGDRLRDPEVRAGARRAANGLSTAVGASVVEFGRRGRRTPPGTGPGAAS